MTREVAVEQVLIGWSRTSNGKNILARSPGWPSETPRSAWVAELGDFLHPGIDRLVRDTGEVPWLVEFLPHQHGSILMAKAYAAESQRAGEFQVHALLDPSRTLGPQHLPALVHDGVLLTQRPDDVTRLQTRRVEVPPAPRLEGVRPVALVLQFLHRGAPLLLRGATPEEAADLVGGLAAVLPAAVAARTPARSLVTDAADARGIAVAVSPWSRGADGVPTLTDARVDEACVELAERMLAGEWSLPADGRDLAEWLDLVLIDLLRRSPADQAAAQLSRWPTERLGVLVDALIRSEDISPELLMQAVDRLPGDEVRRLVQRHWPTLGRQLGLPASVVQALKPARSWLGW